MLLLRQTQLEQLHREQEEERLQREQEEELVATQELSGEAANQTMHSVLPAPPDPAQAAIPPSSNALQPVGSNPGLTRFSMPDGQTLFPTSPAGDVTPPPLVAFIDDLRGRLGVADNGISKLEESKLEEESERGVIVTMRRDSNKEDDASISFRSPDHEAAERPKSSVAPLTVSSGEPPRKASFMDEWNARMAGTSQAVSKRTLHDGASSTPLPDAFPQSKSGFPPPLVSFPSRNIRRPPPLGAILGQDVPFASSPLTNTRLIGMPNTPSSPNSGRSRAGAGNAWEAAAAAALASLELEQMIQSSSGIAVGSEVYPPASLSLSDRTVTSSNINRAQTAAGASLELCVSARSLSSSASTRLHPSLSHQRTFAQRSSRAVRSGSGSSLGGGGMDFFSAVTDKAVELLEEAEEDDYEETDDDDDRDSNHGELFPESKVLDGPVGNPGIGTGGIMEPQDRDGGSQRRRHLRKAKSKSGRPRAHSAHKLAEKWKEDMRNVVRQTTVVTEMLDSKTQVLVKGVWGGPDAY